MLARKLRRFLALPGLDRRLLLRAFVSLVEIEVELRTVGLARFVERISRLGPSAFDRPEAAGVELARHYARWIAVAATIQPFPARCLHRSLALHRWLRQEGLPSELRIGVRKAGRELEAHAWVELAGIVVNDRPSHLDGFIPLVHGEWAGVFGSAVRNAARIGADSERLGGFSG